MSKLWEDEANKLFQRFQRNGCLKDANKGVRIMEQAIGLAGDNATPDMFFNCGMSLASRFLHSDSIDDINRAISLTDKAVDGTPCGHADRASYLEHLGTYLSLRFSQTWSMADLDRAISVVGEAVDVVSRHSDNNNNNNNNPKRASYLSSLGSYLAQRFEQTGSMADLNRAISVADEAIDGSPRGDPLYHASHLSSLGNHLGQRFEQTGSMADLNRAISVASEAVDAIPRSHPVRASYLGGLGKHLCRRFERTGSTADLDRAVGVAREAVDASPRKHPSYALNLHTLAITLTCRSARTGSADDLDQAIEAGSEAVNAVHPSHTRRPLLLNNLGAALTSRFYGKKSMDDLHRAIGILQSSVDAMPPGHSHAGRALSNLARALGTRFEQTGAIADADRAISLLRDAAEGANGPERAGYLFYLGCWSRTRFRHTCSVDDFNRALESFTAGWHCRDGRPSIRIRSANAAAYMIAAGKEWTQCSRLLRDAVSLFPAVSPRSLGRTDVQSLLAGFYGLPPAAAAAALNDGNAPADALRLLELGRGVVAGLLMDMRRDITALELRHPDLADKFARLRDELDSPERLLSEAPGDGVSSWERRAERRRTADEEFGDVVDAIRARPEFSDFLQPPAAEELMRAAEQGPIVVVNVSSFGCDAFTVEPGSIRATRLADVTEIEVARQVDRLRAQSDLSSSLEWLWHNICRPILDALGFRNPVTDGNWPHVWWIPTGLLSQVPLHAAGIYRQASKERVLDRVVSSYAPSIRALLHGRRHHVHKPTGASTVGSALVVAMQETPGLPDRGYLRFANDEADMLEKLCPQLQLAPIMPPRRRDDIIAHLQECKVFHFAGHGKSDQKEPSRSCLLLEDWEKTPLTVGDVRDSRLQESAPFLAYLSACSTGLNKETKLSDEGIHLVSAFQLAGFRHVVGTLWEVSDKHCVDVARILYKTLQEEGMTDAAVSRGLHRALRMLRNGGAGDADEVRDAELLCAEAPSRGVADFFWVPYVHFGA
ncbi:hypothetical protein Trco_008003 [Trichoderma cornu-damae]|uniref:CHAT domain-containing protein n=1 Tax=Trichoderma cornu-damae TaxID=654480 RepID=A0A9P8QHY0_9HYPO|nr:hypothetical protein Trco_008003 [Trichoderma cornu-damae]